MDIPITEIRLLLAEAVDQTSLRKQARAVGLSPSGLKKFLDGSTPYRSTERKVRKRHAAYLNPNAVDAREELIEALLRHVSPDRRAAARNSIMEALDGRCSARDEVRASDTD